MWANSLRCEYHRIIILTCLLSTSGEIFAADPEVTKNSIGMKLVKIPAGEFMMGAEEDRADTLNHFPYCAPEWLDGELPRHKVRITKSFDMGQHEVTLGQFLTFYHDAKYKVEIERDGKPSWGYENNRLIESNRFRPWAPLAWKMEMDHPVVYVSWNDSVAFCEWLSKKEGRTYRLPTEAEWEYACRAGSNSRYHFGDDQEELVRFGNVADKDRQIESEKDGSKSVIASFDKDGKKTDTDIPYPFLLRRDGYAWTAPVGKFRPNGFGLYDMHGNVWEWCSDWYDEKYYETSPVDDPPGPGSGSSRVARGGGFNSTPVNLRCARRDYDDPSNRDFNYGFRVVRVRE
jgi:formylglycine-generating enzyme required for sulfatase activity